MRRFRIWWVVLGLIAGTARAQGVGHSAATACARIATSPAEFPASLLLPFAGASDVGVGHIAAAAGRGS